MVVGFVWFVGDVQCDVLVVGQVEYQYVGIFVVVVGDMVDVVVGVVYGFGGVVVFVVWFQYVVEGGGGLVVYVLQQYWFVVQVECGVVGVVFVDQCM